MEMATPRSNVSEDAEASMITEVTNLAGSSDDVAVDVPQQAHYVGHSKPESPLSLGIVLDYAHILSVLAFFGMIGVMVRYGLDILLGPGVAHLTDDTTALFIDLPANLVGSFIMGGVGVVAKKSISAYLDPLAVGLSTGLCGCLTTFASWNQRVLAVLTKGSWVVALAAYVVGAELSLMSLVVGMDATYFLFFLLERWARQRNLAGRSPPPFLNPFPDNLDRRWRSLLIFFSSAALLWAGGAVGTILDTGCLTRRQLWLAMMMSPFGVWIRWLLSRFNGRGFGTDRQHFDWLPFGTFLTNVIASCGEAVTSIVHLRIGTSNSTLIAGGLQMGFLGSMSTVSTLVVELHKLHGEAGGCHRWRAYAYLLGTLLVSLAFGLCVYSIPVWSLGLKSAYNRVNSCTMDPA